MSSSIVNLDCGEESLAEEPKLVKLSATNMFDERVIPLLRYLDGKMVKYNKPTIAGYYIELVRSRIRTKVTASAAVAKREVSLNSECATVKATLLEREKRLQQTELECAKLQKSLAAEKDLCAKSELECTSLCVDIDNAWTVTVDLWDRLEASRVTFNEKSRRVDELITDMATRNQLHAVELAAKAKKLADCEAARSLELEQRKRLDADCNKMQS